MNEGIATPLGGRRVLVTGGAGVIGAPLVRTLSDAGAEILCADLAERPSWIDAAVDYRQGDAAELDRRVAREFGPEYCFHLAATFERTEETPGFWLENYRHNVRLSHRLAAMLAEIPTMRRCVFASSYLIYDPTSYLFERPAEQPVPLSERSPIRPRNLCGAAKLLHEMELDALGGFDSCSARIFRVYGRGSKDVVSRWARTLAQDPEAKLDVYRLEGMFDYIYADDVAEALLRLASASVTGAVNVGNGTARHVGDVIAALREHFPALGVREVATDAPYEAHVADLSALRDAVSWSPQTDLETGVARIVAFERARADERSDAPS
jgi:carbamoyl-phosphate synthase large subunit